MRFMKMGALLAGVCKMCLYFQHLFSVLSKIRRKTCSQLMLMVCELCENRHRKGHTILMDVNKIMFYVRAV